MAMLVQLQSSNFLRKIHSNALPFEEIVLGGNGNLLEEVVLGGNGNLLEEVVLGGNGNL